MDGKRPVRAAARSHLAGITLIELLFVLLVIALLASLAAPSFHEFILDARRTAHVNGLLHTLHAARSAAILRNQPTVVCKSADQRRCTPTASGWGDGWIAFVNKDHDLSLIHI